ncbi:MAG TPA: hypothetical protein VF247_05635 [Candidatus Krumholzibacteria bacterium]
MSARRRIGLFLLIGGILLLGASGWFWRGDPAARAAAAAKRTVLEDSASHLKAMITDNELKKRGFQNSLPDMPDTVQKYGGARTMEILGNYTRRGYMYEIRQRDVKLELKAIDRESVRERAAARAKALPAALAGAASVLIGAVLTATSGRRVGA